MTPEQRDFRQMACGDGMCWQGPLCEAIDDLRAENERLREALQRIVDQAHGRIDAFVAPSQIALYALAGTKRTTDGSTVSGAGGVEDGPDTALAASPRLGSTTPAPASQSRTNSQLEEPDVRS